MKFSLIFLLFFTSCISQKKSANYNTIYGKWIVRMDKEGIEYFLFKENGKVEPHSIINGIDRVAYIMDYTFKENINQLIISNKTFQLLKLDSFQLRLLDKNDTLTFLRGH